MNERIRELAEQAFRHAIDNVTPKTGLRELEMEKFAELIVRECVNVCEEHAKTLDAQPSDSAFEQYEDGIVNGIYEATAVILDHFGVENNS